MDKIYTYIEERAERALALLEQLCRQPSISDQGVRLEEMAELVATVTREYGLTAEILPTDGGPPLVYGEISDRSPQEIPPISKQRCASPISWSVYRSSKEHGGILAPSQSATNKRWAGQWMSPASSASFVLPVLYILIAI